MFLTCKATGLSEPDYDCDRRSLVLRQNFTLSTTGARSGAHSTSSDTSGGDRKHDASSIGPKMNDAPLGLLNSLRAWLCQRGASGTGDGHAVSNPCDRVAQWRGDALNNCTTHLEQPPCSKTLSGVKPAGINDSLIAWHPA